MIAITAAAALDVAALQRGGYRGVALLSDPMAGCMILFRSEESGCLELGAAPIPVAHETHVLVQIPALVVPLHATPEEAFQLTERELRRKTMYQLN